MKEWVDGNGINYWKLCTRKKKKIVFLQNVVNVVFEWKVESLGGWGRWVGWLWEEFSGLTFDEVGKDGIQENRKWV